MDPKADSGRARKPWWLQNVSPGTAYTLVVVWLLVGVGAVGQVIFTDDTVVRWASVGQGVAALVLAGMYFASARYDGPRRVGPPSTSRWAGGRPEERWH